MFQRAISISKRFFCNPVIVVPFYRSILTDSEKISLSCLRKHLAQFEINFLMPEHLQNHNLVLNKNEFIMRMPNRFFISTDTYNSLLLSRWFYEQFIRFSHILVYQLDCLVFSDCLQKWCCSGWDYMGAPLLKKNGSPELNSDWFVGNGGLSLRKVRSFLRVLRKKSPQSIYYESSRRVCDAPDVEECYFLPQKKYRFNLKSTFNSYIKNWTVDHEVRGFRANEDVFWSIEATKFDRSFKVAPFEVAFQFAVEKHPSVLIAKNQGKLPFGCHAWDKYDPDFWDKFI
jgi:hypothetical protein